MNSYLLHFVAYTFAMIGFIVMILFVYKKTAYPGNVQKNKDFLCVENSLKLSATKTVYVIKAGNEKFLVAGDTATTTMLAKLNDKTETVNYEYTENKITEIPSLKRQMQRLNRG